MERPIIEIDEEKCDGCGQCILDCAEGALAMVDGKARLVSDVYCDGLGACLNCPRGALSLTVREAPAFDEHAALQAKAEREKSMRPLMPQNKPLSPLSAAGGLASGLKIDGEAGSVLKTWPLQLELMPSKANYLHRAHMALCAHCSGFALADIQSWLAGRVPIIACPKLENNARLVEKLKVILDNNEIESLSVLRMSVPCCGGLARVAEEALAASESIAPLDVQVVNLHGGSN